MRWQPLLGYEGIGVSVLCYHVDASPFVARCAFYLDLLYHLFQDEVCLQLYGTPCGPFLRRGKWLVVGFYCTLLIRFLHKVCPQSGKIIGSSIKVSLNHEENMDFEYTESSQKRSKGTHESQSEDAKKNKKTVSNLNAGKCDQHVIRFSFE